MSGALTAPGARHIELTPIGIKMLPGATREELREQALQMLYVANMAPLYAADLIILMRDRFGDDAAAELIPAVGKTKHTVENWISIARRFPLSRRKEGLEMGHYDAVSQCKGSDGKAHIGRQDQLIEKAAREGWTVAQTREEAKEAAARLQGKVVDVPDIGKDEDDEERPVMDSGAVGESLAAERAERGAERADSDGFDDLERMRRQWAKLTPDLHIRFLRSIMTADLFAQIAPDFQQSRAAPVARDAGDADPTPASPKAPAGRREPPSAASGGGNNSDPARSSPIPAPDAPAAGTVSPDRSGGGTYSNVEPLDDGDISSLLDRRAVKVEGSVS